MDNSEHDLLDRSSIGPRDGATQRLALLTFLTDEKSEAALQSGLTEFGRNSEYRRGNIVNATKHLQKAQTPRILVVDISGVGNPIEALEQLAHVCTPDVKVVVVGEDSGISFYRTLVRDMGVTEYLQKPVTRDAVLQVLQPQLAGVTSDSGEHYAGKLVTVTSARGGSGGTTIAANLALQLSRETHSHVVLLDLHLQTGTCALLLGQKADNGLRTALEQPERADALFLERVAISVSDRLRLVASEAPFDTNPLPKVDALERILDLLRRRFNYVVVDLPLSGDDLMRATLSHARHRVIVLTPEIAALRDAERLRKFFATMTGGNRSVTVLNRMNMPGALKAQLVEQALGEKPLINIADFGKLMVQAGNLGQPALDSVSGFARTLLPLTCEISGQASSQVAGAKSILAKLAGR